MMNRAVLILYSVCLLATIVASQKLDCATVKCLAVECDGGSTIPAGQCCPQCTGQGNAKCNYQGNRERYHLEVYWNECKSCTCENGVETCTKDECTHEKCKNQKDVPLTLQNKDPCAHCVCTGDDIGSYQCYYMACLLRYCPYGYTRKNNECCPSCRKAKCNNSLPPV